MSINSHDQPEKAQKSDMVLQGQIKPTIPSKGQKLRRLKVKRLGRKKREGDTKDNKIDVKNKTIALP